MRFIGISVINFIFTEKSLLFVPIPPKPTVSNKLSFLPDSFVNLSRLEKLDLGFNCLQFLPEGFHALKRLRELNLRENPLKVVPDMENMRMFHIPPDTLIQVRVKHVG